MFEVSKPPEENPDRNVKELLNQMKMKKMSYRPRAARRVYMPNGQKTEKKRFNGSRLRTKLKSGIRLQKGFSFKKTFTLPPIRAEPRLLIGNFAY
ncbi:MAG: hypothetical protein PVH61_26730 [Candidatus Aminicenantes bacterium]|jgi:hypothetical protein